MLHSLSSRRVHLLLIGDLSHCWSAQRRDRVSGLRCHLQFSVVCEYITHRVDMWCNLEKPSLYSRLILNSRLSQAEIIFMSSFVPVTITTMLTFLLIGRPVIFLDNVLLILRHENKINIYSQILLPLIVNPIHKIFCFDILV